MLRFLEVLPRSISTSSKSFASKPFKVRILPTIESYPVDIALTPAFYLALRKSADNLIMMVEIMGKESAMPCFGSGVVQVVGALRTRFQLHLSQDEAEAFVENDLIAKSIGRYEHSVCP